MTFQTRFLSGSNPIVIDYLREHRSPEELKEHARANELILRKGVGADQEIDQNPDNYLSFANLWLQAEWATSNTNPQLNFQDYAELEAKR
ncbi:MAG: hypothetical protein JW769_03620, partial [Parachlamydiales bacterium]|nr:hypothetical protein [Parachlamydiales bacterium]